MRFQIVVTKYIFKKSPLLLNFILEQFLSIKKVYKFKIFISFSPFFPLENYIRQNLRANIAKLQIQPESGGHYIQVVVVVVVRLYAKIQTRTNMSQTRPDQKVGK